MNTPTNTRFESPADTVDLELDQMVAFASRHEISVAWTKDIRRLREMNLDRVAVKNLLNNIVNRPYWTIEDVRMEARLMLERLEK